MNMYSWYRHFNEVLLRLSHYNNFSTEVEMRLRTRSQDKGHYLQSILDKTRTFDVPFSILGSC